jgi:hypothetical protein
MTDTNPWRSAGAERTDWRDHAACSGLDTDLFFPVSTSGASRTDIEAARRICQCCPVMTPCLRWALDLGTNGSDARVSPTVLRGPTRPYARGRGPSPDLSPASIHVPAAMSRNVPGTTGA